MNRFLKNLGVLIFATLILFLLSPAIVKAWEGGTEGMEDTGSYSEDYSGFDAISASQPGKCVASEGCSRVCVCSFEGRYHGRITKADWIFYAIHKNFTLAQAIDADNKQTVMKVMLNVTNNPPRCEIKTWGLNPWFREDMSPKADTWVTSPPLTGKDPEPDKGGSGTVRRCETKNVFCCCDVSDNERSGCKRVMTPEGQNNVCPNDQSKFPETSGGCEALNGDMGSDKPIVRGVGGKTAAESIAEAKALNKLTQYGPANATGVAKLIGQIIKFLTGWLASIALIFYLYAGFTWMTAGGNTEKIATAKKIYVFTTIGLAAVIGSYFVVSKLFNFIAP